MSVSLGSGCQSSEPDLPSPLGQPEGASPWAQFFRGEGQGAGVCEEPPAETYSTRNRVEEIVATPSQGDLHS